jgi:hypothetical protein
MGHRSSKPIYIYTPGTAETPEGSELRDKANRAVQKWADGRYHQIVEVCERHAKVGEHELTLTDMEWVWGSQSNKLSQDLKSRRQEAVLAKMRQHGYRINVSEAGLHIEWYGTVQHLTHLVDNALAEYGNHILKGTGSAIERSVEIGEHSSDLYVVNETLPQSQVARNWLKYTTGAQLQDWIRRVTEMLAVHGCTVTFTPSLGTVYRGILHVQW